MSVVDEIKAQLDIVDLISESVKLRHTGKNYTGFCPFHSNTRTPAFVVFPETQTWRCFGQCNEGGDIFGFVMKKEGWDFSEALNFLAEKAGVTLTEYSPEDKTDKDLQDKLSELLERAALYFRQQMLETPPGRETLNYLHQRGLTDQTIKIFGLGHAPDGWDGLLNHLKHLGYDESIMLEAGLITERESGGYYDRFRNRLMFPIRSTYGKMVGFGGRVLDPNDVPKYINSPKTALFDKGRLLYGLDQARQSIRSNNQVVIVEGYMDAIACHQANFANVVSPMGTALTEDQFRLVKKFTRRIVLALDPDAAGEKATLRGLETARQIMDQDAELRFDARGLLHFEARLNADIRIATLPGGKDPDEIVLADPDSWRQIISAAKPVVEHVMETLVAARDINDAKVKSEIAAQVLPLIEDVPDRVEREAYRQRLARLIKVDERALLAPAQEMTRLRNKRGTQKQSQTQDPRKVPELSRSNRALEKYSIQFLYKDPEKIYQLDHFLQSFELESLSHEDFLESDFKTVMLTIEKSLKQDEYAPNEFVERNLSETILDELSQSSKLPDLTNEVPEQKESADLFRTVLRLRLNRVNEHINDLLFLQSEVSEDDNELALVYQAEAMALIKTRKQIDTALQSPAAAGRGKKTW